MKNCPKCGAKIQENARFCLYCMTSFEEKKPVVNKESNNKRWLIIIAAVLVLVIILLSVFALNKNGNNSNSKAPENSASQNANNDNSDTSGNGSDTTVNNDNQTQDKENNSSKTDVGSNNEGDSTVDDNTTQNEQLPNDQITPPADDDDSNNQYPPPAVSLLLEYRDAKQGDDFAVGTNLENCIVITGVKTPIADGEYIIPDQIDNKKVIAIAPLAFCGENVANNVKSVVIPSSVKTIWNDAFATCYNLTDIYFMGDSVYTDINAFPEPSKRNGKLTIHCSQNCSDRNFRYYKNSASYYGAEYKEWNG